MGLKSIMLNETNREIQMSYDLTYMWNLKQQQQQQKGSCIQRTDWWLPEVGGGGWKVDKMVVKWVKKSKLPVIK